MAKVNWKTASSRRVVGDWVPVTKLDGIEARIKPRKYSQAGVDEINSWAIQRQARLKRDTVRAIVEKSEHEPVRDDAIMDVLANADPELLKQSYYMGMILRFGISEYDFGDETGKPDDDWIAAVLDDVDLAAELMEIAKDFNSPLPKLTPDTSGTSLDGNSKE